MLRIADNQAQYAFCPWWTPKSYDLRFTVEGEKSLSVEVAHHQIYWTLSAIEVSGQD